MKIELKPCCKFRGRIKIAKSDKIVEESDGVLQSYNYRVYLDDVDISGYVRKVSVDMDATEVPFVRI